ncbi:hypothetical protein [Dethiobacter alkaliphilus]|uniref:Uncharacterized protein n=1 Tax=Dethiobacter alkaliphilus AHT 1 TaxID=555088 RepID=C0GJ43_DETAL|nr:hypothetical protein [Dethiobacter alkaliphilus]EEG76676.1 hypothetical protein DealDRAFT_2502 [Dethiobacter alkaliphilus AHT 1]MCW3489182.1 hypothetical protein [Dethiobacter alkaliphilus]
MGKKLTKRQRTVLTLSSILLAIASFIGLLMGLALLYYFFDFLL